MGFVPIVTGTCVIVYVLTVAMTGASAMRGGLFSLFAPSWQATYIFGASGAVPVFQEGRWWTLLSASFLHGGLLHILFNMLWVRQLAPAVAELYGPGRMVIIYTAAGVAGFLASSTAGEFLQWIPVPMLRGAPLTVGASASIFGLLGAIVYYGRRAGSSMAGSQAWNYAVILFIFGFIMPGIDNYAHAGGFGGGYLAGRLLDPLKPERINHMLAAVICLAASILAVLVSVLTAFI
jgi:rhomboid protease GluP